MMARRRAHGRRLLYRRQHRKKNKIRNILRRDQSCPPLPIQENTGCLTLIKPLSNNSFKVFFSSKRCLQLLRGYHKTFRTAKLSPPQIPSHLPLKKRGYLTLKGLTGVNKKTNPGLLTGRINSRWSDLPRATRPDP